MGVAALESGIREQHAVIGAHRKTVLEGRARGLGPERHDGDPCLCPRVPDAQRRFQCLLVERAHDHLQAGGRDDFLRRLVDPEHAEGRLRVRHLLYTDNDMHREW